MKILLILLMLSVIIVVICAVIANYLVHFVLDRQKNHKEGLGSLSTDPEELKRAINLIGGDNSWKEYFRANCEERHIMSHDGIDLCGFFLKGNTDNFAIFCHGYTSSHGGMLGKAKHFYDKGYGILLVDARGHGKSGGRYRGMGWTERFDMQLWIAEVIKENKNAQILLYGQSMGGSTVINTAGEELPDNVRLIISDCGYMGVWEEFSLQLKVRYHLPSFPIMNIADFISKKKAGFTFREASSVKQIKKCCLPILLIHGKNDDFVPYDFVEKLYEAANEPKEILVIDGARHCMSEVINPELYWKTVDNFVEKYM